jgi:hypothetical protein
MNKIAYEIREGIFLSFNSPEEKLKIDENYLEFPNTNNQLLFQL